MSCISFNITVVNVFTEILIYRLRSSFVKGGKKAPPINYYRTPTVVMIEQHTHNHKLLLFNYHKRGGYMPHHWISLSTFWVYMQPAVLMVS